MNRRAALRLLGSITAFGIAGCTGSEDPSNETPERQSPTDAATKTSSPTEVRTQTERTPPEEQRTATEETEEQQEADLTSKIPDFSQWLGPEMAPGVNRSTRNTIETERIKHVWHTRPSKAFDAFSSTDLPFPTENLVRSMSGTGVQIGSLSFELDLPNIDMVLRDLNRNLTVVISASNEPILNEPYDDENVKLEEYNGYTIGTINKPNPERVDDPRMQLIYDAFAAKSGILVVVGDWYFREDSIEQLKPVLNTYSGDLTRYVDESRLTKDFFAKLGDGFHHEATKLGTSYSTGLRLRSNGDQIERRYVSLHEKSEEAEEWADYVKEYIENRVDDYDETPPGGSRMNGNKYHVYSELKVETNDNMVIFDSVLSKEEIDVVDLSSQLVV